MNHTDCSQDSTILQAAYRDFRPIPFQVLPEPLSGLIREGSASIGCDASFLVLPLLSLLGALIGNTRRLVVKENNWVVPPIIWTAIIGESGSQKSPAINLITKPIKDYQHDIIQKFKAEYQQFTNELEKYEKELNKWKKEAKENIPLEKPHPPRLRRVLVSDTTIEALIPILRDNARGVLVINDELAAWLGSFDKYSNGGGDQPKWLSMYNADSIIVDRKTGIPPTTAVPSAATSITGGIQPAIFRKLIGESQRQSGLLARMLLCKPPKKIKQWSERSVSDQTFLAYSKKLNELMKLEFNDNFSPKNIRLGDKARKRYIEFFNSHARDTSELTNPDLEAAFSKLEETPLRLALILHCCMHQTDLVEESTIDAAVELVDWFKHETIRVYTMLWETKRQKKIRELIEWIRRKKNGKVTARDVQIGRRNVQSSEEANQLLQSLVDCGEGFWQNSGQDQVGAPTRYFRSY